MNRIEQGHSALNFHLALGLGLISLLGETLIDVPGYLKVSRIKSLLKYGKRPRIVEQNALRTTVKIYSGTTGSLIIDDERYLIRDLKENSKFPASVIVTWGGRIVHKRSRPSMRGKDIRSKKVQDYYAEIEEGIGITHYPTDERRHQL